MAHAKPNHVRPTTHAGYEERVTDGSDTIEESGQDLCVSHTTTTIETLEYCGQWFIALMCSM